MIPLSYFHVKMKTDLLLGALAKLQKATISFVMSVSMENLGSHWTDFYKM
jgi:hypothetical protein